MVFAKLIVLTLLFGGEAVAIAAEMIAARSHGVPTDPFLRTFLRLLPLIVAGSILLLAGYMLGYRTFRNIWLVSAISITSILIIEPLLAWTLFHQAPTKGALLGLLFGAAGFASALFL